MVRFPIESDEQYISIQCEFVSMGGSIPLGMGTLLAMRDANMALVAPGGRW